MIKTVYITKTVLNSLLSYFTYVHPEEGILLLRGKITKDDVMLIDDLVIPPQATHGNGFSSFPLFTLPLDASILGTVHSHPSGVLKLSTEDFNHFYGRIMMVVGYPYLSEEDIAVFNREGKMLKHQIITTKNKDD